MHPAAFKPGSEHMSLKNKLKSALITDAAFDQEPFSGEAKKYLICATPRTGSTFLCRSLVQTGVMGIPFEYFNRTYHLPVLAERWGIDVGKRGRMSQRTFSAYFSELLRRRTTANGVFGIKVMTDHFFPVVRSGAYARHFGDATYVYLTRKDIIAQAISFVIAMQTRRWHSYYKATKPSRYDAELIERHIKLFLGFEDAWRLFFAVNRIEPLQMFYEDLVADPATQCRRVCEWVGVETDSAFRAEDAAESSVSTEINREWAERYRAEAVNRPLHLFRSGPEATPADATVQGPE